ncbi:MAG: tol-pal system protein YbgF [Desulfotignum sp.]|nr:tol-pal system protein YbgF [Desulfotignum sp.]
MRTFLRICLVPLLMMLSGCVTPDQYQVLENRVNALEMENSRSRALQARFDEQAADLETAIKDLEKTVQAIDQFSRENIAEINQELQQVHKKHGELQGMMEETAYRFGQTDPDSRTDLTQVLERMDRTVSRNHVRITRLETYMGFEPTVPGTGEGESPDSAVPGEDTGQKKMPVSDKAAYEQAKKTFDDGDMEAARIQFENFINTFPESPLSGNARFWIADSYYVEKWYEKAILEYQKVLEKYPNSNKVAAARLKQGYAFAELGEKANARLILNELITRYPDSREAMFAKEKLKQLQ